MTMYFLLRFGRIGYAKIASLGKKPSNHFIGQILVEIVKKFKIEVNY